MWWLCLFSLNIYCQKFVILQRIGEPTRKRNVNIVEQEDCIAYLVATHNERAGRLWFQSLFSSSSPTLFNLQRICHSWAVPRCCFQIAKWHIVQYIDGKPMNKSSWYSAEAKLFSRKLTTALSGQKLAQRNWHQPLSWRIPDYAALCDAVCNAVPFFFSWAPQPKVHQIYQMNHFNSVKCRDQVLMLQIWSIERCESKLLGCGWFHIHYSYFDFSKKFHI